MQRKLVSWEGNAAGIPGRDAAVHEIRWKAVMPAGLCWPCLATLIAGARLRSRDASLRSLCNPPLNHPPPPCLSAHPAIPTHPTQLPVGMPLGLSPAQALAVLGAAAGDFA